MPAACSYLFVFFLFIWIQMHVYCFGTALYECVCDVYTAGRLHLFVYFNTITVTRGEPHTVSHNDFGRCHEKRLQLSRLKCAAIMHHCVHDRAVISEYWCFPGLVTEHRPRSFSGKVVSHRRVDKHGKCTLNIHPYIVLVLDLFINNMSGCPKYRRLSQLSYCCFKTRILHDSFESQTRKSAEIYFGTICTV